jgi:hypothetical protein
MNDIACNLFIAMYWINLIYFYFIFIFILKLNSNTLNGISISIQLNLIMIQMNSFQQLDLRLGCKLVKKVLKIYLSIYGVEKINNFF